MNVEALAGVVAGIVREFVEAQTEPLQARIAELEAQDAQRARELDTVRTKCAALEARAVVEYHGVWSPRDYNGGAMVTLDSNLWIARQATNTRPGVSDAWQLAQRRPRACAARVGARSGIGYPTKSARNSAG